MGDIVVTAFEVLAVVAVLALGAGVALKSRPLVTLGASLLVSLILTWVLGLLGLPIGIVFGFLGGGALFRSRRATDRNGSNVPPSR
jgi:hypothetical protein